MGYLIDTCVFIANERGRNDTVSLLSSRTLSDEIGGISAITVSELLHGVHRAENAAVRVKRSAFVEDILRNVPIYPFDTASARVHAEIWAWMKTRGIVVGAHDLIIAATALSLGFGVITLNHKDFTRIPGLNVLSP